MVTVKRVYEPAAPGDGRRVLVDRLWPRGLTKQAARIDHWAKTASPSSALRKWYGHEPGRWPEFQRRYLQELSAPEAAAEIVHLARLARAGPVTLLTATKAEHETHATILRTVIAGTPP